MRQASRKRTDKKLGELARLYGKKIHKISELASIHGINRIKIALALGREHSIPVENALQAITDSKHTLFLSRNTGLQKFLARIKNNKQLRVKNSHCVLRLGTVMAGSDNWHGLLGLSDLRVMAFPRKEDKTSEPELKILDKALSNEDPKFSSLYLDIPGTFGYVEIGVVKFGNETALLVTNGQARKRFFQLPPRIRNKFCQWYEAMLNELVATGKSLGINKIIIPSNDLVNQTLLANFNHVTQESVLDVFYDRFAEKRKYARQSIEVEHIGTGKKLKGEFRVSS